MSDQEATKTPFGEQLKVSSGYDGIEAATIETIGDAFGTLLIQNWSQIKSCRNKSDNESVAISFGVEVNASGKTPVVKAKIAYSQKFSDTFEAIVDDPDQEKLPLDVKKK